MKKILVVLLASIVTSCSDHEKDSFSSANVEKIPFKTYQVKSQKADYRKAMLGQYKVDSPFEISGKVFRWNEPYVHLYLSQDGASGVVLIQFESRPELIEDDFVKIYGRYKGIVDRNSVRIAFSSGMFSDPRLAEWLDGWFGLIGWPKDEIPLFQADYYSGPANVGNFPSGSRKNIPSREQHKN